MVFTYTSKTLDTLVPYTLNTTGSIDLPRDRYIRQLDIRLVVNHTNAATAPTWIRNAPLGIMKELRLVANGNDNRVVIKPTDQYDINTFDFQGVPPRLTQYSTVSSTGDSIAEFSIPFAFEPLNPTDLAEVLEALEFSSLKLYVDFGAASDIASANAPTIVSVSCQATLREVDLTSADLRSIGTHLIFKRTYEQQTISAAASDMTFVKDIPVGAIIRRIPMFVVNNSLLSNALVTYYKVTQESPISREVLPKTAWEASRAQDQREYTVPNASMPDGFTIMDFEANPLNLKPPIKQGDIKFKATNIAPTGTAYIKWLYDLIY